MSMSKFFAGAFVTLALPTSAFALTVGGVPVVNPPGLTIGPFVVATGGNWFEQFHSAPGWAYDGQAKTLRINNVFIPTNTKFVLLTIDHSSAINFQPAGTTFDPANWPGLSARGSINPVAAADYFDNAKGIFVSQVQWTIRPQPNVEYISFAKFDSQFLSFIEGVRFETSCVPEPQNWALMIIGFGVMGGAMRKSRTREAVPA